MDASDYYRERQRRRDRDYAEIVRNLTDVLQERSKEIERLQDLLQGAKEQLYESRKKYQELHHRCDKLEYRLFCRTCKEHKDQQRKPGDTFEYLNCSQCKPLLSFDSCESDS